MDQRSMVFISAVSDEFSGFRELLAGKLERELVSTDLQEKFVETAADVLRKVAWRIRNAQLVVHIVGYEVGTVAAQEAVDDLFNPHNVNHIPKTEFKNRLPEIDEAVLSELTYTQWEAILALYFNIPLLVFVVKGMCDPTTKRALAGSSQRAHLDRLFNLERVRLTLFEGESEFIAETLSTINFHFKSHPDFVKSERPKTLLSEYFEPSDFIGRTNEIKVLSKHLRKEKVLNLVGPGGAGKTWLANQLLRSLESEFPDGSWVVELAGVPDDNEVVQAVKLAIGFEKSDSAEKLADYLEGRKALLVLDNCEHLIEGCRSLINSLCRCRDIRFITTSTTELFLNLGFTEHVGPMSVPGKAEVKKSEVECADSVQLLQRHAAQRGFSLTDENAAVVAEICRSLDGIPLAIKIAAVWCDSKSPASLRQVLESVEEIIEENSPLREGQERHRSVSAVVERSFGLLPEDLKQLLLRLSIFRDGFSTDAAHSVCYEGKIAARKVKKEIRELADFSLVECRDIPEDEDPLGRRYRLLEPIRLICKGKLESESCFSELAARHCDWCIRFLEERHEIMAKGGEQLSASKQIFNEHDNIRAAMHWCRENNDTENALRLTARMWRFWEVRGFHEEGRQELAELIEVNLDSSDAMEISRAYTGRGMLAYRQGNYEDALPDFRKAHSLQLSLPEKDILRICMCKTDVANALNKLGDASKALRYHQEVLEDALAINNQRQIAVSRFNCATVAFGLGLWRTTEKFEKMLKQSEEGFRSVKMLTDVGYPMTWRGWLAYFNNDYNKAYQRFERAYQDRKTIESEGGMFLALIGMAWSEVAIENPFKACSLLKQCFQILPRLKSAKAESEVLDSVFLLACSLEEFGEAVMFAVAAEKFRKSIRFCLDPIFSKLLESRKIDAENRLSDDELEEANKWGLHADGNEVLRRAEEFLNL